MCFKSIVVIFYFSSLVGGKIIWMCCEGGKTSWTYNLDELRRGAKLLGRVAKGVAKILDFEFFLIIWKNKGTRIRCFL